MWNSSEKLLSFQRARRWLPLGVIALVALVGGLILPQAMPSTEPPALSHSAKSTDENNGWTYVPPAWPEPPNNRAIFLRLGLGTLSVLALCAGTLWGCKRWLRAPLSKTTAGTQMRYVESLTLGNRCQVHLVQMGGRSILVGADAGGIKSIVPLPESFSQTLLQLDEAA